MNDKATPTPPNKTTETVIASANRTINSLEKFIAKHAKGGQNGVQK